MVKSKVKNFTASDGERIYYRVYGGEGQDTVICLHGLGGSGKEFSNIVKALQSDKNIVIPDYRGHGKSKNAKSFSQLRTAQDLYELINLLKLKNITLIGSSLGAHIIFRYITEYGQAAIRSIVLIDMSPKLTNNSEWKWGYNKGTYTEDMLKYDIADIREDTKGFKQRVYIDFLNYIRKDENKIERPNVLHKAAAMLFFPQIIVDTWEDLFSQDYRDVLSKITRPCAIIYGNPGSIYSEGTAEYMNSKIKNSTMFALEGIRHENMLKQTSKIVDIIKEYI